MGQVRATHDLVSQPNINVCGPFIALKAPRRGSFEGIIPFARGSHASSVTQRFGLMVRKPTPFASLIYPFGFL